MSSRKNKQFFLTHHTLCQKNIHFQLLIRPYNNGRPGFKNKAKEFGVFFLIQSNFKVLQIYLAN